MKPHRHTVHVRSDRAEGVAGTVKEDDATMASQPRSGDADLRLRSVINI